MYVLSKTEKIGSCKKGSDPVLSTFIRSNAAFLVASCTITLFSTRTRFIKACLIKPWRSASVSTFCLMNSDISSNVKSGFLSNNLNNCQPKFVRIGLERSPKRSNPNKASCNSSLKSEEKYQRLISPPRPLE